jgi:hypothetical protein
VATGNGTEATNYNSYSFTTPASLSGKVKVEFYMRPGSGFAESQWTVSVYQSSTRQNLSTDSSNVTYLVNRTGKFTTTVDLLASTAYTLRFARVAGAGSATLNIANVIVGPGIQPQGAVVGEWLNFPISPVATNFGTTVGEVYKYQRVGPTLKVKGKFQAGTRAGVAAYIGLPSGFTIDTTALPDSSARKNRVGDWNASGGGSPTIVTAKAQGAMIVDATNSSRVYFAYAVSDGNLYETSLATNVGGANSEYVAVEFEVPIAEWAGSGTVNVAQNDVEYAWNSDVSATPAVTGSGFGYGPSGVNLPSTNWTTGTNWTRRVLFQTPVQPTDVLVLEALNPGAQGWSPFAHILSCFINSSSTYAYGANFVSVPGIPNAVDVTFLNGGVYPSSTFGSAPGTAWTGFPTFKWRLRKTSAGAAVGFGIVQPGVSSGLVSASGLPGKTDGGTIASGYVGETVQGQQLTSTNFFGNGVFGDVTSISLTAGKWSISAFMIMNLNGATSTGAQLGISTTAGNSSSGLTSGDNIGYLVPPTASYDTHGSIPSYIVNISSTTTYYLKAVGYYSAGTPQYRGRLTAIRIA